MDIATIVGLLVGISLILWGILMNSSLILFINAPGFMIVVGGTIASTLISYPISQFLKSVKVVIKVLIFKAKEGPEVITNMVNLSKKARKEGFVSLEEERKKVSDNYLRKGLQLLIDGMSRDNIEYILTKEVILMQKRHKDGRDVFLAMAKYAPAFGMAGTLIGLIQMLVTLDDVGSLGPKMAVALLTTFYGVLIANLICNPVATKLKHRSEQETLAMELTMEGILGIESKLSSLVLRERLKIYLQTRLQKVMEKAKTGKKKEPDVKAGAKKEPEKAKENKK